MSTRKTKIRVYRTKNMYKVVYNDEYVFYVTPVMVHKEGEVIAVGNYAKAFYDAIAFRNTSLLRSVLQNMLYILNL
jgi:hypothetical protein